MTENETIKELHEIRPYGGIIPQRRAEALDVAIKALEEVQQYRKHGVTIEIALNNMCDLTAAENLLEEYRAIGTPEECRKAMEKQIPQKPFNETLDGLNYFPICPNCHQGLDEDECESFCECGQRLDWSDVE